MNVPLLLFLLYKQNINVSPELAQAAEDKSLMENVPTTSSNERDAPTTSSAATANTITTNSGMNQHQPHHTEGSNDEYIFVPVGDSAGMTCVLCIYIIKLHARSLKDNRWQQLYMEPSVCLFVYEFV